MGVVVERFDVFLVTLDEPTQGKILAVLAEMFAR